MGGRAGVRGGHGPAATDILAPLIGTPWARGATGPQAYDCWSFAALLQRELKGRELPLAPVLDLDTEDSRAVIEAIRTSPLQREWLPVPRPGHGDLVLMYRHAGASHCGVWIEADGLRGIAHCARHIGVALQGRAQLELQYRGLEFRRPAGALIAPQTGFQSALMGAFNAAEQALAIIVRHPEQPLVGAEFVAVDVGDSPAGIAGRLAGRLQGPLAAHWLVHNAEPLLRRHPATGEDEWATRRLAPGDVLWIAPVPPAGGDGSNPLAAIASIGLALVAPFAVGALGIAALGSAGALTFAGQLVAGALTLGGNLLISALVQPSLPQAQGALEGPSPTYTLSPPGNQLRPGGQVPWICGTLRRQPDLLARPYQSFADNEQTLYTLLSIGAGRYRINEIGIGDTPVWTEAEGDLGVLDATEIEIVAPGDPVTLFPADVQTSVEVGGQELAPPEDDGNGGLTEDIVGPFTGVAAGTLANRIECDFAFARGLFRVSTSSGDYIETGVTWRVELREIDAQGDPLGAWTLAATHSVTLATPTPQRLTYSYPVLPGRYEVRCTRESESEVEEGRGGDELSWVGLKAYIPGDQRFDNVTALAIRAKATEASPQAQQSWYVDATRILPRWDSATQSWIEEPTERIEAAIREIVTGGDGLALPESQLDLDELQRLAELWETRGDVCCLAIDTGQGCWDVLEAVCATGRARPQLIGHSVSFMRDEPRAMPAQLITQADIVRGSLEISRRHFTRSKPNALKVRFWNRAGTVEEVDCVPPGVVGERRWATMQLPGIVDRDQAYREGVTIAAANQLRRTTASWTMLDAGRALRIGELVAVAHLRPGYGRPTRVASVDWPRIRLTDPQAVEENTDLWLRLTTPDGGHWGPVLCTRTDDDYTVFVDPDDFAAILAEPQGDRPYSLDPRDWLIPEATLEIADPAAAYAPAAAQMEPTRAVIGTAATEILEAVVLGTRPGADGSVEVLAAREHDGVHTAETGVVPPKPAGSSLSPASVAPSWLGANVTAIDTADGRLVRVAGPAPRGGASYIMDFSTDGGVSWSRAATGFAPSLEALAPSSSALQVRYAAIGLVRGPWGVKVLDTEPAGLPVATGLALSEPADPHFRWSWDADSRAALWVGVIGSIEDGVRTPRKSVATAGTAAAYLESEQVDDGGPWRESYLELVALDGTRRGPEAEIVSSNPPPPAPGAPIIGTPVGQDSVSVSVGASPAPDVRGYIFALTNPLGDPELGALQSIDTPNPAATFELLDAGTSYDVHVAAYDAIATGLIWSPATSFTTASEN